MENKRTLPTEQVGAFVKIDCNSEADAFMNFDGYEKMV